MNAKRFVALAFVVLVAFIAIRPTFFAHAAQGRPSARSASLKGTIVDLYTYMTDGMDGDGAVKMSRKLIRGGVPVALVTEKGLVILGQGKRGPARTVEPLTLQEVWAKGRLFEKDGVRYLDVRHVAAAREGDGDEGAYLIELEEVDDPDAPPDE